MAGVGAVLTAGASRLDHPRAPCLAFAQMLA
jgi:hypothetical protein